MKNLLSIILIGVAIVTITSCNAVKGTSKEERIGLLETAINNHSYNDYMECFDVSTNYKNTYLIGTFNIDYPSGSTVYKFGSLTISGDTVTCSSTINTSSGHTNTFTMIKTGNDYFILKWVVDGFTIFQKK